METKRIIAALADTPRLLKEMMAEVPRRRLKDRRIPGKWAAYEHAVHITRVQPVLTARLKRFMTEAAPEFVPYFPGTTDPADDMITADLKKEMKEFARGRRAFLSMLKKLKPKDWRKKAKHPEYDVYTPYIMARHLLLHDHVHMYRIEELWLTRKLPHK